MSNLEDLLQARLAELRNPTTDLETQITEVLQEHQLGGFVQDALSRQMIAQCFCGHPLGEFPYAGAAAHQAKMLAPLIREAQAEALREAADWLADMASGYLRSSPQLLAGRDIIAQIRARADKLGAL